MVKPPIVGNSYAVKSPPPPPIFLNVGPEFNVNAVEQWLYGDFKGPARKSLSITVMRHLSHMGWMIHYHDGVHYFKPPTDDKQMFTNLIEACNHEQLLNNKEEMRRICHLLYQRIPTVEEDTTWTVLQVDRTVARENQDMRLSFAHYVLVSAFGDHFSNMLESIVYSIIEFSGFYTTVVQKNNEIASVANFRIHTNGDVKFAEIPFVTTAREFRGQRLCNILMNTLQDILNKLGVDEIILPSVPSTFSMWNKKFGFSIIDKDKEELIFGGGGIKIVNFRDTIFCATTLNHVG
ncbi:unnamed protein product [Trifolium pratense]|uniref:Uncharacterized protein n=1 Tax=Trifolium pratense TaxID=57577 RepID=A0ACB0JIR1_TRIPR|nr:unnamed protein product [Trifolium pratense]